MVSLAMRDRLVLVAERLDGEHRPERLLVDDRHRRRRSRRGPSAGSRSRRPAPVVGPAAAAAQHRALGQPGRDVRLDLLAVRGGDQRAGLGRRRRTGRRAGSRSARRDQLVDELVVDRLLDDQPGAGRADLAGVQEDRGQREVERGLEVGVGEHDVGVLAAQLEGDLLHRGRGRGHDPPAGGQAAGERDQVDAGVLGQRRAGVGAGAEHEVGRRRPAGRPPRAAASAGSRCAGSARSA